MTRLPTPGQDDGTWGNLLNDFLSVEHNTDGTLKNAARPADVANKYTLPANGIPESDLTSSVVAKLNNVGTVADNSITTSKIANNAVTNVKLDSATQTSLSKADTSLQPSDITGKADTSAVLLKSNNLSDLPSASSGRTNLGLGTAATRDAGSASGVATLDGSSKLTSSQLPTTVITKSSSSGDTGKAIDAYTGLPLSVNGSITLDLETKGINFDGSDEGAAVNALIAASSTGSEIRFKRGATLGTTVPIILKGGRSYDFGPSARGGGSCTIKALTGFSAPAGAGGITGIVVEETFATNTFVPSSSGGTTTKPMRIRGLSIDGNRQSITTGRCVERTGSTTNGSPTAVVATTDAITIGSQTIQAIIVGMNVWGPGIPPGTTVQSIAGDHVTITLSQNATSTASNLLVFGSAVCGLILCNYWTDLDDIHIIGTTGYGVLVTDRTADGTTTAIASASGSGSEIRWRQIRTSGTDLSAIAQRVTTANTAADGHADDFYIANCTGYAAVYFDDATGLQFRKLHGYGVLRNGFVTKNAYAHQLGDVYLENFGQEAIAGQTYRGVWANINGGRKLDWDGFDIASTEAGGSATYNYVQLDTTANQNTIYVDMRGLGGSYEGGGTSRGTGLLINPSASTRLEAVGTIPRFKNIAADVATSGSGDVLFAGGMHDLDRDLARIEPLPYPQASSTVTLTRGLVLGAAFRPKVTKSYTKLAVATPGSGAVASGSTHAYLLLYSLDSSGSGTLIARSADDTTLFTVNATYYQRTVAFDGSGSAITSIKLEGGRRYAVCALLVGGTTDPVLKGTAWISAAATDLSTGRQSVAGQTDFATSLGLSSVSTNLPFFSIV